MVQQCVTLPPLTESLLHFIILFYFHNSFLQFPQGGQEPQKQFFRSKPKVDPAMFTIPASIPSHRPQKFPAQPLNLEELHQQWRGGVGVAGEYT